jgi:hypothetical protein
VGDLLREISQLFVWIYTSAVGMAAYHAAQIRAEVSEPSAQLVIGGFAACCYLDLVTLGHAVSHVRVGQILQYRLDIEAQVWLLEDLSALCWWSHMLSVAKIR